jgi:hypothetical protein
MDVRLSAPSGPLKRPKRLGGRATEAKWAQREQLPLPLGLSVHQSHDFILLAGRPATARPPPSPRPPPASAGTPSCLRRDAALPPPGRRRDSSNPPPPVHQGTTPPSTLSVPSHTCVLFAQEKQQGNLVRSNTSQLLIFAKSLNPM